MKSPSSLSERVESLRSHRADPGPFGGKLGDDVLLEICRVAPDDPENTAAWRGDLRRAVDLLASQDAAQHARLEDGLTLLTAALGRLAQCNPTLQPFGHSGPTIEAHGWIDDETLERVGKQIVGMVWPHSDADDVAVAVEHAVSEAVRLGFLEQCQYDAWRPGMVSGSGWRWAVSATPYGVMKARAAQCNEDGESQAVAAHADISTIPLPRQLDAARRSRRSGKNGNGAVGTCRAKNAAVPATDEHLSDTEANIVEALGTQRLTGEALAKQAGYPFNSNFKSTLSSLRKRGVLGNASPGYFVTAARRRRADQGQDKGQD